MSRWLKRIGVSTIALSCVVGPAEAGPMLARVKSNSTAAIDKAASGKSVGELSGTPAQSGATPMNGGGSVVSVGSIITTGDVHDIQIEVYAPNSTLSSGG